MGHCPSLLSCGLSSRVSGAQASVWAARDTRDFIPARFILAGVPHVIGVVMFDLAPWADGLPPVMPFQSNGGPFSSMVNPSVP